jgi:hypothetical protein
MADATKVRIAVEASRELEFEVDDPAKMVKALEKALSAGDSIVWITDSKGNRHGIRVANLAFVEIEGENQGSGVGFGLIEPKG